MTLSKLRRHTSGIRPATIGSLLQPIRDFPIVAKTMVTADNMWADKSEWEGEVAVHKQPKFVTNLRDVQVTEGGRSHFEARVVPQSDPHLRIEWLKDGAPLQMG